MMKQKFAQILVVRIFCLQKLQNNQNFDELNVT